MIVQRILLYLHSSSLLMVVLHIQIYSLLKIMVLLLLQHLVVMLQQRLKQIYSRLAQQKIQVVYSIIRVSQRLVLRMGMLMRDPVIVINYGVIQRIILLIQQKRISRQYVFIGVQHTSMIFLCLLIMKIYYTVQL